MIFRHSLRMRIVIAYSIFGAVLGTVFAVIVYVSLDFIDDNLVNHRLTKEVDYLVERFKEGRDTVKPSSIHIKAFLGIDQMPAFARQMVQELDEGFHEVYNHDDEYHIAVKYLPNQTDPLYVLYDVSALEFTENRKLLIGVVLFTSVFLVTGLGFWIGLMTSRKVIAPVVYLAEQVNKSGPEKLPTDLSKEFYNDEIGVLAQALEKAMIRVDEFIKREQQVARDASHELRTPVTVIKGAVEILKQQLSKEGALMNRPLNRIERSVKDMESIIETFLWLAREEAALETDQTCEVVPIVKEAIEENQHLFSQKSIQIEFNAKANPVLNAPAPALKVAIINLIQNAFHYTLNGKISVQISMDRVTISDTGKGIEPRELVSVKRPHYRGNDSPGFGLGLAIVNRLCNRFGWHFDINSKIGKGTTVHLIFSPQD